MSSTFSSVTELVERTMSSVSDILRIHKVNEPSLFKSEKSLSH